MGVYDSTVRGVTEGRAQIPTGAGQSDLTDWIELTDTASHPKSQNPIIIANLCGETAVGLQATAGVKAIIVDLQWTGSYWKFRIQLSGNITEEEKVGYIAMSQFG